DSGPAREARFRRILGLASGPGGSIYIADSESNRVRVVASDGFRAKPWPRFAGPSIAISGFEQSASMGQWMPAPGSRHPLERLPVTSKTRIRRHLPAAGAEIRLRKNGAQVRL
ncbi:MAG: hypothetical protein GY856_35740, partial [bacterium]|nr:hypothetical protein [bacterium]